MEVIVEAKPGKQADEEDLIKIARKDSRSYNAAFWTIEEVRKLYYALDDLKLKGVF